MRSVILVAAISILPSCTPSSPTAETAPPRVETTHGGMLSGSIRSEPRTFNPLVSRDSASSLVAHLTQAPLVRINRATDRVEPWIAESWTAREDGLSYEFHLRQDVQFSDGSPLTSADVLFTLRALYDERVASPLADSLRIQGQPIEAHAPDADTVVVSFPKKYSPGVRLFSGLPILPRHRLSTHLDNGTMTEAWGAASEPAEMSGLGPFVLTSHQPGQRLVFSRNPYYWRKSESGVPLPHLDGLTLEIVPGQDAEMLRLESGTIDFIEGGIRATDYASLRRAEGRGTVQFFELGVALDADFLFFNLKPEAMAHDPRRPWIQSNEFRRAVSEAVDRESFADTVYLGLGDPVYGPVTPANRRWHRSSAPKHTFDRARARDRLAALGLTDLDGDGRLEGPEGHPVRFTLLTQQGHSVRARAAAVLAQDLGTVGIGVDVVLLDFGALIERLNTMDFDAAFIGFQASDTDPAVNLDLWLSSAAFHFWNPSQLAPGTEWERRIDELMNEQISVSDEVERKRLFDEVQQIFGEFVPALYFAAPRVFVVTSTRVGNASPALIGPSILWNADALTRRGGSGIN